MVHICMIFCYDELYFFVFQRASLYIISGDSGVGDGDLDGVME